jgi:predicted dehydrogenase
MSLHAAVLAGAGAHGRTWAKTLSSSNRTQLAGWVDPRDGAVESSCEELGLSGVQSFSNVTEAISSLKPDFIVDVTPPDVHCETVCAALSAGIPVLGEKPMAASMEQAAKMVKASEDAGKLYMVSQSRRYNPQICGYRDLVRKLEGAAILNADFFIGAHFGGFRDEMPSPLLLDMSIHTFDQARFLLDADPESVYCEEFNPGWSWYKGDACANALFGMSGGSRFAFRGSWCSDGLMTSWDSEWRAIGPKGTAIWDGDLDLRTETVHQADGFFSKVNHLRPKVSSDGFLTDFHGSLSEFLDAIDSGSTPQGECHDNIKSLAMVFAALKSSKEGRRVAIDEVMV